ncbi:MAG TPA: NYN domain-containing protein [Bauldia sp.]|nr:NYN domain-containing protein [Bauldia sp.]
MAEPTKSVLLVDYDSVQRSLAGATGETRLADRAVAWLAALESGRLLGDDGNRRRLVVKRCYIGPSVRGKPRDALAAAGFEMVDAAESGTRNAADLHIAMDTVELLARGDGYEEFVILSAGAELKPLLARLKGAGRTTAIYADDGTSEPDKTAADLVLETADFARFLNAEPKPAPEAKTPPPAPSSASSERADIEAFARRIHAATNIPLFSPKTYAELFRHLTDEITANGYHFQSTAKNVAERMVAGGRNVNRRQIVFIVKGLALKGHVFSTNDTPERLAEVFREQARYLIGNAGIPLTDREENLLSAWFLSRPPPSTLPKAAPPTTAAPAVAEAPAAAKAAIAETIEREVAKAVTKPPAPDKAKSAPRTPAPPRAQPVRPVDLPKSAAAAKPVPLPTAREEAKAVIAARIAGAAKMKPAGTRTPLPAKPAPKVPPPPAPPVDEEEEEAMPAPPPPTPARSQENADALESSILAAIAEAVDVLVEDSAEIEPEMEEIDEEIAVEDDDAPPSASRNAGKAARPSPPEPEPEAEPDDDAESGDIGDQIQRIIASYNRNRGDE